MKMRMVTADDNRQSETTSWEKVFSEVPFEQYVQTLDYDEPTEHVKAFFADKSRDAAILDIGCGGGRHLYMLRQQLGFDNISGLDVSVEGVRLADKNVPGCKALVGDASRLPYAEASFDYVLMVGVVYEIEDRGAHQRVAHEIARVLKPGGALVFVCKSPYSPGEKIYTLTERLKGVPESGPGKRFFIWRWEKKDVHSLFDRTGLRLKQHIKCNFGLAIYRYFYGKLVQKDVRENRRSRIKQINTYTVHEHYQANKDPLLFNQVGRFVFQRRALFGRFFYGAEVYIMQK